MKPNSIAITAIIVIGLMQIAAMFFGINGTFRAWCMAAIGSLIGWRIPSNIMKGGAKHG